ncbi:preprotein translocase subunit SecE [Microbacteriaceae bacterium]|nr:preprotein translocase subunit SecE [Candidatus Saccharibacteria bacterium]
MAKPAKKSDTTVTRIKASDSSAKKVNKPARSAKVVEAEGSTSTKNRRRISTGPFGRMGRYIKGSWYELRQVRWPDRRATWGMTGALLAFTMFFVVIIILLDAAFSYLFKLIIGS